MWATPGVVSLGGVMAQPRLQHFHKQGYDLTLRVLGSPGGL